MFTRKYPVMQILFSRLSTQQANKVLRRTRAIGKTTWKSPDYVFLSQPSTTIITITNMLMFSNSSGRPQHKTIVFLYAQHICKQYKLQHHIIVRCSVLATGGQLLQTVEQYSFDTRSLWRQADERQNTIGYTHMLMDVLFCFRKLQ